MISCEHDNRGEDNYRSVLYIDDTSLGLQRTVKEVSVITIAGDAKESISKWHEHVEEA